MTHSFRWHFEQVFRALSRLLNALTGGEGDTTYSAASWGLYLDGHRCGHLRVKLIDHWQGQDHCRKAWEWHRDRGLLDLEGARPD